MGPCWVESGDLELREELGESRWRAGLRHALDENVPVIPGTELARFWEVW